jgi:hypothetical protein
MHTWGGNDTTTWEEVRAGMLPLFEQTFCFKWYLPLVYVQTTVYTVITVNNVLTFPPHWWRRLLLGPWSVMVGLWSVLCEPRFLGVNELHACHSHWACPTWAGPL